MRCAEQDLLLYAVTDRHWLSGRSLRDVVEESLRGGVTMLQLREKTLAEPSFLAEARELQALCRDYHVPFLVNDNVDIALAMDADGVHVGQSDMEALDVRRKLGPDKIIGVSAQTVEQALLAEKHGADYLGVGGRVPHRVQGRRRRRVLRHPEGHLPGRVHSRGGHRRHQPGQRTQALRQRHLRHRRYQRHLRRGGHPPGEP